MNRRGSGRSPIRFFARASALAGTVLAVSVCSTSDKFGSPTGPTSDTTPPAVQVILPGGSSDTLIEIADSLKFNANATDNVTLDTVRVTVTGLGTFVLTVDTTIAFKATTTTFTAGFVIPLPQNAAGQRIEITVAAVDGATNRATVSDTVHVNDTQAPVATILTPSSAVLIGSGDTIRVLAKAVDPSGIRILGARLFYRDTVLHNVVSLAADSLVYSARLTARVDSFKVIVPATLKPGNYLLQVFAADSSPNYNKGASADLAVAVRDVQAPAGVILNPPVDSQVVAGTPVTLILHVLDNTGVVSVVLRGYSQRGSPALGTDTTVLRYLSKTVLLPLQPADTTPIIRQLVPVASDSTAEPVFLEARITDVGGNVTVVTRRIQVVGGPSVRATTPLSGSRPPIGVPVPITVVGYSPDGLTWLGYQATGVVSFTDSLAVAPAANVATRVLSLLTTQFTPLGADTIVPFAKDNAGRRLFGSPVFIVFGDTIKPTVTIDTPAVAGLPVALGDSVFVSVHVKDNRGVTRLVITGTSQRGSVSLGTDSTVMRYFPKTVILPSSRDTVITRYLRAVSTDSLSELVTIAATATDSSGNSAFGLATVRIVGGPKMTLVRPTLGAVTAPGRTIVIEVAGTSTRGVRLAGWRTTGVLTTQDSAFYSPVSGKQPQTVDSSYTVTIPPATPLGSFTVVPFGKDSIGDVSAGTGAITVLVQSGAADITPPTVTFTIGHRIEVDDSININVRDAGGVYRVGWTATLLGTATVVGTDTTASLCLPNCVVSDATMRDPLNLPLALRYPAQVVLRAFAWDSTRNYAVSAAETLTVVAGKTYALPVGSKIADAVYNERRRELYLSNFARDQIEVFSLASNSFVASIPVGSRPWGIVLWPRKTSANPADTLYADTLIVANSGGTNLSIVDLVARREVRRHRLPNYVVEKVKTVDNGNGGKTVLMTGYDFSDRPEFVAAVCRAGGATGCDSVIAIYSTTPTNGQTYPAERGYVAWENLADTLYTQSGTGHFFWEQASDGSATGDSVQIIRERRTAAGVLVSDTVLGGARGERVDFDRLGFRDTTYIRNSGNFLRTVIGEGGGGLQLARVMTYDATAGRTIIPGVWVDLIAGQPQTALSTAYVRDNGISPAHPVQDFIGNRASSVTGVAMNFNGMTNLVRADSIYVFDAYLRQTGLLQVSGLAHGMDLAPLNAFDANARGTTAPGQSDARIVFAARPDSSIDVFDTYFFAEVTDTAIAAVPIPIRNALTGAVRVTPDLTGTVLTGISTQGLVVVRLPVLSNPFLAPALPLGTLAPRAGSPTVIRNRTRPLGVRVVGPFEE